MRHEHQSLSQNVNIRKVSTASYTGSEYSYTESELTSAPKPILKPAHTKNDPPESKTNQQVKPAKDTRKVSATSYAGSEYSEYSDISATGAAKLNNSKQASTARSPSTTKDTRKVSVTSYSGSEYSATPVATPAPVNQASTTKEGQTKDIRKESVTSYTGSEYSYTETEVSAKCVADKKGKQAASLPKPQPDQRKVSGATLVSQVSFAETVETVPPLDQVEGSIEEESEMYSESEIEDPVQAKKQSPVQPAEENRKESVASYTGSEYSYTETEVSAKLAPAQTGKKATTLSKPKSDQRKVSGATLVSQVSFAETVETIEDKPISKGKSSSPGAKGPPSKPAANRKESATSFTGSEYSYTESEMSRAPVPKESAASLLTTNLDNRKMSSATLVSQVSLAESVSSKKSVVKNRIARFEQGKQNISESCSEEEFEHAAKNQVTIARREEKTNSPRAKSAPAPVVKQVTSDKAKLNDRKSSAATLLSQISLTESEPKKSPLPQKGKARPKDEAESDSESEIENPAPVKIPKGSMKEMKAKVSPRAKSVPTANQGQGSKANRMSDWNQRMEDVENSNVRKVEKPPPAAVKKASLKKPNANNRAKAQQKDQSESESESYSESEPEDPVPVKTPKVAKKMSPSTAVKPKQAPTAEPKDVRKASATSYTGSEYSEYSEIPETPVAKPEPKKPSPAKVDDNRRVSSTSDGSYTESESNEAPFCRTGNQATMVKASAPPVKQASTTKQASASKPKSESEYSYSETEVEEPAPKPVAKQASTPKSVVKKVPMPGAQKVLPTKPVAKQPVESDSETEYSYSETEAEEPASKPVVIPASITKPALKQVPMPGAQKVLPSKPVTQPPSAVKKANLAKPIADNRKSSVATLLSQVSLRSSTESEPKKSTVPPKAKVPLQEQIDDSEYSYSETEAEILVNKPALKQAATSKSLVTKAPASEAKQVLPPKPATTQIVESEYSYTETENETPINKPVLKQASVIKTATKQSPVAPKPVAKQTPTAKQPAESEYSYTETENGTPINKPVAKQAPVTKAVAKQSPIVPKPAAKQTPTAKQPADSEYSYTETENETPVNKPVAKQASVTAAAAKQTPVAKKPATKQTPITKQTPESDTESEYSYSETEIEVPVAKPKAKPAPIAKKTEQNLKPAKTLDHRKASAVSCVSELSMTGLEEDENTNLNQKKRALKGRSSIEVIEAVSKVIENVANNNGSGHLQSITPRHSRRAFLRDILGETLYRLHMVVHA